MCGIAGYSGRTPGEVSDVVLNAIGHRGPDGRGRYDSPCGSVSLFHVRLAILDPTPDGTQPMFAADGQVAITFNGEIYNFRELRLELQARGYNFRTRTDTEVVLALYLEYGAEMLSKLRGIYAFGIWDARQRVLFVARDQLGVKPLYFSEAGGAFAFASEIKALLHMPWVPRVVDTQALAHYLRFLWCPAPRTAFLHVKKLEPGTALIVRDGRISRRWQHYALPSPEPDHRRSVNDWLDHIRSELAQAVERQMVSDVPLGAFLSGGLDSSAVVAYARQRASTRLQCFTIDFGEEQARQEGFSRDLPYAERVASHLDVDLHVVRVGSEMASSLSRLVWHLDEPQADFAALNVLFISQLAAQRGIKVLLSGAGGDDLFTGYRRHRALALTSLWGRTPRVFRNIVARVGHRIPVRPPGLRRARKVLETAACDVDGQISAYFDWAPLATIRKLFRPDIRLSLNEEPIRDAIEALPEGVTSLQRMLLIEQRHFLPDHNLAYTDKMSMAVGVETRVPFLDPSIVDLAARIPDGLRQRGGEGKWILKRAMEGVLPNDVIYRSKTGFGVPLRAWLRGPLKPLISDLLGPETVRRRGIFDADSVMTLVSDNESGRIDCSYTVLGLMCIELWCQQFLDAASDVRSIGAYALANA